MATLSELQSLLTSYQTERNSILTAGQNISGTGGRSRQAARIEFLEKEINFLESRIAIVGNSNRITSHRPVFGGHRG